MSGRFVFSSPCTGAFVHAVPRIERLSWEPSCRNISRPVTKLYASEESEPLRWFAQMTGTLWLPLLPLEISCSINQPLRASTQPLSVSSLEKRINNRGPFLHNGYMHPWRSVNVELREHMDKAANPPFRGWGHEEKKMLLPLATSQFFNPRMLYEAAVRKWRRLYDWGESKRQRLEWHADAGAGSEEEEQEGEEDAAPEVQDEWEKVVAKWEDPDWAPF